MIIPLNWLSDYLELHHSEQHTADSFTALGLMQEKTIKDHVLELEHRMDRADWLSIIGCARDLAAFETVKLKLPKIKQHKLGTLPKDEQIKIRVDTPTVRRFNTRVFKDLVVAPSPSWLVERLEAYGIESKNNLVDITNFVMVEYGQPMHAQDLSTLPTNELHLRDTRAGESVTTLLGTKVELPKGTFVISSGNIICVIGGIVGGNKTGVTNKTTEIILDAGNYDQRVIRANSRKLKIQNETVSRYDKYLDPRLTQDALERATDLILELAGGKVYDNFDYYPSPLSPKTQLLTLKRLQLLSGLDLSLKTAKSRLTSLGFIVVEETDSQLVVEIPIWRTDIAVEDDLIADILRIGNYETLPTTPLTTPIPEDITEKIYRFEDTLRNYLVSLSAKEHITIPLVKNDKDEKRVTLSNALSSDQDALRITLTETLTPVLKAYSKHNIKSPILFEIAKSFVKSSSSPVEKRELAIVSTEDVRGLLSSLMSLLGIAYTLTPTKNSKSLVMCKGKTLGTLTSTSLTLDTELLLKYHRPYSGVITSHSHTTSLDLSLNMPKDMPFSELEAEIRKTSTSLQSIKVLEQQGKNNSILIRLTWESLDNSDKTRLSLIKALGKLGITSRSS